MPNADTSEWIDPAKLADLVFHWANGEHRPLNGSFARLVYKNNTVIPNFL